MKNTITKILRTKGMNLNSASLSVLVFHAPINGKRLLGKHPSVDFSETELAGCKRKLAMLRKKMLTQCKAGTPCSFGVGSKLRGNLPS